LSRSHRRKCKTCREWFIPTRQIQPCCEKSECQIAFAIAYADKERKKNLARVKKLNTDREKKERKSWEKRKEVARGPGHYMNLADKAFQLWVRLRDHEEPCISCGRYEWEIPHEGRVGGKWDGGHYKGKGAFTELRYHEDNCRKQCKSCNRDKSGNPVPYRVRLIEKIGIDRVEFLEGPQEMTRYRIEDYKAIQKKYNKLARELKKQIEETL